MRTMIILGVLLGALLAQDEPQAFTLDAALSGGGSLSPRGLSGLAWHPDGKSVTFLTRLRGGDVGVVARAVADGRGRVMTRLGELDAALKGLTPESIGVPGLFGTTVLAEGKYRIDVGGSRYVVSGKPLVGSRTYALPEGAESVTPGPDGLTVAYVHEHDVFVVGRDGATHRVTTDGHADLKYGRSVSREEFGIKDGLWWSPDGGRVAFYREDLSVIARYPYVDFDAVPARDAGGRYPMAGRRGSIVDVHVFDVATKERVRLRRPDADLYLTNVTFGPKGESIYVAEVNRAQNRMDLRRYDARTGERKESLIVEEDEEWAEPEHGPIFLPSGDGFLWFSHRSGYRHLDHHRMDGARVGAVTKGAFDVTEFKGFRDDGRFLFEAAAPDPRQRHLFEGTLSGGMRQVTSGRGFHETTVSPDGEHVIDSWSSLEHPLVIDVVVVATGKRVTRLHEAPNPLARYAIGETRFFSVESEDGATLHGTLMLPSNLDETKKHPVIQYVYGGPHSQLVQDRWMGMNGRWPLWLRALAESGYVVFWLDGRGTSQRGIEWAQKVFRNLGEQEMKDQLAGLDHVLSLPYTDSERVGVTGWSYGGFMTLTLMTRGGGRYAAGVAGGAVTDWSFYETGYGERYMDTPRENPDGYRRADPGTHADKLSGRLLLVHGAADDVVMFQSAMDFLKDCIAAGKLVDFMAYPGEKHGLRGPSWGHFLRLATRHFDEHVKGR
jgi:dipeptidyl-peptidase-4